MTPNLNIQPDIKVSIKQSFGIESEMEVNAFSEKSEYVPEIDKNYKFDRDTTLAIISGFAFNKRVLVQGISWNREINTYRTNCCKIKLALYKGEFR